MNPSENFPPSFITTYEGDSTLTVLSPLPRTVHDTSTQTLYQPPQQTYQPSVASAQTSYGNPILPDHPTAFFYRPSNDFCHYYIICKEISYDTVGFLLNKSLKEHNIQSNKNECIFYYQQQCNSR